LLIIHLLETARKYINKTPVQTLYRRGSYTKSWVLSKLSRVLNLRRTATDPGEQAANRSRYVACKRRTTCHHM